MLEKVVKETFSPDAEKKSNKVIKDFVKKAPDEDERFKKGSELIEEEPGGGVYEPNQEEFGKGAVVYQDVVDKKNKEKENGN
jgi:hypothetical protein